MGRVRGRSVRWEAAPPHTDKLTTRGGGVQVSCVGVGVPLWRPLHGTGGWAVWIPPDSPSGWLRRSASWCSCQRQPGSGEASHNPFTMRMLARILREHPSGGLERTYSIMVRGSIHICVRRGCGQLTAFLSQLQPAHNLQPR